MMRLPQADDVTEPLFLAALAVIGAFSAIVGVRLREDGSRKIDTDDVRETAMPIDAAPAEMERLRTIAVDGASRPHLIHADVSTKRIPRVEMYAALGECRP